MVSSSLGPKARSELGFINAANSGVSAIQLDTKTVAVSAAMTGTSLASVATTPDWMNPLNSTSTSAGAADLSPSPSAVGPAGTPAADLLKTPEGKEKLFVLHSGLNDPENSGANGVKAGLLARGIPEDRILILPNEFPSLKGGIKANLNNFSAFGETNSEESKQAYARMESMIAAKGLDPSKVAVTMIGHSAGGQASFGMAEVDKTQRKMVDQIITLGSPILNNAVDPNVKITSIDSKEDPIVRVTTGPLARLLGRVVLGDAQQRLPDNLDANDRIIEVKNLDHRGYYQDPNTMAMVADIALGRAPQQPLAATGDGKTFTAPGPSEKPPFFKTLASHLFA